MAPKKAQNATPSAATTPSEIAPSCVELFAGGGGFALGLEQAGWRHLALYEREANCVASLRHNRPEWPIIQADLELVDFREVREPVTLLCGSPPCQGYSERGYRRGRSDERDGWEIATRAVDRLKPTWIAFENVSSMEHTPELTQVLEKFRKRFRWVSYWLLQAADFGVPQLRERLFVVGGPRKVPRPQPTHARDPQPTLWGPPLEKWVSLRQALGWPPEASGILRGHGYLPDRIANLDEPLHTLTAVSFTAGTGLRVNLAPGFTEREEATRAASRKNTRGEIDHRPPDRWKWPGDLETDGMRKPTEEELHTIAGFPAEWELQGKITPRTRQRGNAVCPAVGRAVGLAFMSATRR